MAPTLTNSLTHEPLLTHFPPATWTVDTDLRVTSWNGGAFMAPNAPPGSMIGRPLLEVFHANGVALNSLEMHKQALAGISSDFQVNVSGSDFVVNVSPLRHESNRIIGVVGVALKVAARALNDGRQRRKAAFDHALSSFLGHSVRHQFNDGFYRRLVATALEMLPEAQAGSFWLPAEGNELRAVAALGLGDYAVAASTFTAEQLSRGEAGLSSLNGVAARATLSVPVKLNTDAIAFLFVHNFDYGNAFGEDAEEFLQLFAIELEALFQHAELRRTLRAERHNLEQLLAAHKALAEFGADIETIHDTDELILHGMRHIVGAFQFDTAMFSTVRGRFLHFTRVYGYRAEEVRKILEKPQPLGAGVNGRVAESGEPLLIEDYSSWPLGFEPYAPAGVMSLLALPIRRGGRVAHTLSFATINRRASIDENMLRVANGFVKRLENAFERTHHLDEIRSTREATFRALGIALEYRDLETRGHTDRVVELSNRFAEELGLEQAQRQALTWGAYLHDIGKIAVPDAILLKPGRLAEAEFAVIKKHTIFGTEMLSDLPFLPAETRQVVRGHHERWDGAGYPDQLAGDDIPLLARMFSLIDVYDALRSERPYKRAWTHQEAASEIARQAGGQFDPNLAERFLEMLGKRRVSP